MKRSKVEAVRDRRDHLPEPLPDSSAGVTRPEQGVVIAGFSLRLPKRRMALSPGSMQ